MRTMLKITMPVEQLNKAIKDGTLPKMIQNLMQDLHPEASYFCPEGGQRGAWFVFDMKDSSQIAVIAEPWFTNLNARVEFFPVMNADDLKMGLEKTMRKHGRMPVSA